MGSIRGALDRRGRIASKDGVTEVSAGAVARQSQTRKEPGKHGATQDATNAPQGLAA
jgi:hypothetical protein